MRPKAATQTRKVGTELTTDLTQTTFSHPLIGGHGGAWGGGEARTTEESQ